VEAGGEDLRRLGIHLGLREPALEQALTVRLEQMHVMFAGGQWLQLQKFAAETTAWYPLGKERLRAVAAAAAEKARARRWRLANGARTVIASLRAAGDAVPPELERVVADATRVGDDALAELEQTLRAAITRLPAGEGDAEREVSELATR